MLTSCFFLLVRNDHNFHLLLCYFPTRVLTGTLPTELGQLESLDWLVVFSNSLTGTLPTELGRLSSLLLLDGTSNYLEGTLPTELGLLTSSTVLHLGHNRFVGTIPTEIGLLTDLVLGLKFNNNPFLSGTIPSELGLLTSLQKLVFDDIKFVGVIPSEFGLLTSLGHLSVANNSLSGTIPTELSALQPSLYTLSLEGYSLLSGMVPEALCNLNATCVAKYSGLVACEGPYGLYFNCTSVLCGCGCSCFGS